MSRAKFFLLAASLILGLAACSPALASSTPTLVPTQPSIIATETSALAFAPTVELPASEADVPRVTPADAKAALDSGKAIIVDVRLKAAFEASHIKGAQYIGDLEDSKMNLSVPKDQWIITYCT